MMSALFHTDPVYRRWPALVRIMLSRLLILACILLVLPALTGTDSLTFYAFVALAFAVTIPYAVWLRHDAEARHSAPLQSAVDIVVATGLVHFSGGLRSELFMLYPLIILSAGIVVSGYFALRITILGVILYATVVSLELWGVLPYCGQVPSPYIPTNTAIQSLMLRIFLLVFFSAAGHFLAQRCLSQARQLSVFSDLVLRILDHLSVGVFTVGEDGTVGFANRTATDLLQRQSHTIVGKPLSAFFSGPAPSIATPGLVPGRLWLSRADGSTLPVACEVARTTLPRETDDSSELQELCPSPAVYIVAVRDVAAELRVEDAARVMERLQMTFNISSEIAHSVRNPLTAIQCACEGIQRVIADMRAAGRVLSPEDSALIEMLSGITVAESGAADRELGKIMMLASESPSRLLARCEEARERFCPKDAPSAGTTASPPGQEAEHGA